MIFRRDIVAKMMVLEQLLPLEFERVLAWLARGTLRSEISRLEEAAGQPSVEVEQPGGEDEVTASTVVDGNETDAASATDQEFSDSLLRWAKLTPSLREEDLSGYLHLAASFAGQIVLDKDLPERLRDIAASLMSRSRADQHSVTDEALRRLPVDDVKALLQHLGRMGRDRPADQLKAVEAILRISRQQGALGNECCAALGAIPGDEVNPPAVLLFEPGDTAVRPALEKWRSQTTNDPTQRAIDMAIRDGE